MKTLLKNALIYDGTGEPPYQGAVLVEDDRIIAVGDIDATADTEIDCAGLSLAPGFIDAHSHNDFFYDYDEARTYYEPFIRQGITTQITGNCGFSPFGVQDSSPHKAEVGAGLFEAKAPSSFRAFIDKAKGNLYVNLAPLIGHGTARIGVSGLDSAPLSQADIQKEMEAVDEAMRNGALGGSFGFMYEPGMYAQRDELVAFASRIAAYDGIVTVHPRACSKVAMAYPLLSKPHIEMALDEVMEIMEAAKCRMEYSHLIFVGQSTWKSADRMLEKFRKCRAKGYDIAYDNYAMTYGASVITVICPPWYMALPKEKRHSPLNRLKLRVMIDITRKLLGIDYSNLTIAYINDEEKYKAYEGRNVQEIADSEQRDCLDLYLDMIDASGGSGRVYLDKYYNEELIRQLMEDDHSVFMTDAWVEPRGVQNGAAYQCYPSFLLKGQSYGIPTEKIIHKMTGKTAERFRLKDRGFVAEGMKADLTLFDPHGLRVFPQEPGRFAEGIRTVFVNGVCVLEDGKMAEKRAGEVILRHTTDKQDEVN